MYRGDWCSNGGNDYMRRSVLRKEGKNGGCTMGHGAGNCKMKRSNEGRRDVGWIWVGE